jgi:hypothetical protein
MKTNYPHSHWKQISPKKKKNQQTLMDRNGFLFFKGWCSHPQRLKAGFYALEINLHRHEATIALLQAKPGFG